MHGLDAEPAVHVAPGGGFGGKHLREAACEGNQLSIRAYAIFRGASAGNVGMQLEYLNPKELAWRMPASVWLATVASASTPPACITPVTAGNVPANTASTSHAKPASALVSVTAAVWWTDTKAAELSGVKVPVRLTRAR